MPDGADFAFPVSDDVQRGAEQFRRGRRSVKLEPFENRMGVRRKYEPTWKPCARRIATAYAVTDPLPAVPATCVIRSSFCSSPSADLPNANYGSSNFDSIVDADGNNIGLSLFAGYSANERQALSLATVNPDVPLSHGVVMSADDQQHRTAHPPARQPRPVLAPNSPTGSPATAGWWPRSSSARSDLSRSSPMSNRRRPPADSARSSSSLSISNSSLAKRWSGRPPGCRAVPRIT